MPSSSSGSAAGLPPSSNRTSTTLNSTLRTRTRRLVPEEAGSSGRAAANPLEVSPGSSPSRTISSRKGGGPQSVVSSTRTSRSGSASQFSSVWTSSMSAIQGFASNILSNDGGAGGGAGGVGAVKSPFGNRKRSSRTSSPHTSGTAGLTVSSEWGPSGSSAPAVSIGTGSHQDHTFLVREAKRKALLSTNGGLDYNTLDSFGKFKRRNSDDVDPSAMIADSDELDGEALVYIHKVCPGDTLAGLTIKYNCQLGILRKANRMWPNDPIQSRKTIMLPVDVCGVKGKLVPNPSEPLIPEEHLIYQDADPIMMHESPNPSHLGSSNGWATGPSSSFSPPLRPSSPTPSSKPDSDPPWKHDSWVMLPNDTSPTEIVRLPRQNLGFFPRARRKSLTHSDLGISSRTTSFDISRSAVPSRAISPPGNLSPSRRSRSSTSAMASARISRRNNLEALLSGPGGVGPMDRSTRLPGPGPDRLAELLAPNLADYAAPPAHQTVFTPWAPALLDEGQPNASAPGTLDGTAIALNGSGPGFADMSHSIETFVRKTIKRATSALESTNGTASPGGRAAAMNRAGGVNPGVQGLGLGSGMGDLIELVDAFEVDEGQSQPDPFVSDSSIRVDNGNEGSSAGAWYDSNGDNEIRGRKRK